MSVGRPNRPWYLPGEAVHHERYGDGTVIEETDDWVEVRFGDEPRRFLPSTAALQRRRHPAGERVYPQWAEIDAPERFLPPLTKAERTLVHSLDACLPAEWRIYVRPHLAGDLPSLALLHPAYGALLWDVVEGISEDTPSSTATALIGHARLKLEAIRDRIYRLHVPSLTEAIADEPWRFGTIGIGVFCLGTSTRDLQRYIKWGHVRFSGFDGISRERLVMLLPSPIVRLDAAQFEALEDEFRQYYQRPKFAVPRLDARQREIVQRGRGQRQIVGVAGSGKSLILVNRAASIANQGGNALILTYNRTLVNYIRGLLSSVAIPFRSDRVTVQYFHGLCATLSDWIKHECLLTGTTLPEHLWRGAQDLTTWLEVAWPRAIVDHYSRFEVPDQLRFDSVLIDEGQDMSRAFLDVIGLLPRSPNADRMVAIDAAQRLYARTTGFSPEDDLRYSGRVTKLDVGYRVSRAVARAATKFAVHWALETDPIVEPDPDALTLPDGSTEYLEAENVQVAAACAINIVEQWVSSEGLPHKTTILVPSKIVGASIVELLGTRRIATNHLFLTGPVGAPMDGRPIDATGEERHEGSSPLWKRERSLKQAFAFGDQRMKVSTVHSYKGWESDRLICVLPDDEEPDALLARLVYVAMTRSRDSVTFIGTDNGLGLTEVVETTRPAIVDRATQLDFARHYASAKARYKAASDVEPESLVDFVDEDYWDHEPPWPTHE